MRSLADTIERLKRVRSSATVDVGLARLEKLEHRGANPGNLTGWYQTPKDTGLPVALVVVLHGCTQTAAGYDAGSGWSKLADDFGFGVLFPEQSRQNNPNLCFNWFSDGDIQRVGGEAHSIREMIDGMISDHGIDQSRVFITGLSAGGAMANAMLTAYPEVFAGGAIIAGLPYGVASTIPEAFDRVRGHGLPGKISGLDLARVVAHRFPWAGILIASRRLTLADIELPPSAEFFAEPYNLAEVIDCLGQL